MKNIRTYVKTTRKNSRGWKIAVLLLYSHNIKEVPLRCILWIDQ